MDSRVPVLISAFCGLESSRSNKKRELRDISMKIACIGDIHGSWDSVDEEYFSESDYDLVLFTGDLPSFKNSRGLEIASSMARVKKEKAWILGNHDSSNWTQILGEMRKNQQMIRFGSMGHVSRWKKWTEAFGQMCGGYDLRSIQSQPNLYLMLGRPLSMGGGMSFIPTLKKLYGVNSLESSLEKYKAMFSRLPEDSRVLVLAHNGPTGLGAKASSIWGCDFRKEEGDWGDEDLRLALEYASQRKIHVPLVLAGHMHYRHKRDGSCNRTWYQKDAEGRVYLNAAEVPRIQKKEGLRHHVRIELKDSEILVQSVWISEKSGEIIQESKRFNSHSGH